MKGRRNKKRSKKKQKEPNLDEKRINYQDIVRENEHFETYYKLQKICSEDEWDDFKKVLQSDLPTAFRIAHSITEGKALLKIIQGQYFRDFLNAEKEEGSELIEPVPLPWYPDNLAWQVQLTRKNIRRCEAFFRLHNFLILETESGNISRQEVVSMIPPLALDIKSNHKILDMCAAPGSKTAQLIEHLHKCEKLPDGFVIANDIDNNRCYMLVHQAKRLKSPNIIVTNHDASIMPNFIMKTEDGKDEILKFDRILCDVPCTGDGTLRKNPDIWTKWNTANGNNLHGVQFRILKRGCEMLAINGRLVYSTCSLNPIENEAVIMRMLREAKGSLKLIDLSSSFPGLKYKKGLMTWLPASRDVVTYKSFDEVPEKWHTVIRPQMFPPSEEEALQHNLDRCIRVLPHHQNTGGFFLAALEKVDALPWESLHHSKTENNEEKCEFSEPTRKKRRIFGYKEDPYIFFNNDDPLWLQIRDFYEVSDRLPGNCFLTRCKVGKKKNIYFTSPQVRELMVANAEKVKIINAGVKAFARCDNKDMKCPFRLTHEVLWCIFPYIGSKRQVKVTKDDLLVLLSNDDPKYPTEIAKLDPATREQIKKIGHGSCILVYNEETNSDCSLRFELAGWIGAVSARAYIHLKDKVHYLRLLGGDTSKFDVNKFRKEGSKECSQNEWNKAEE